MANATMSKRVSQESRIQRSLELALAAARTAAENRGCDIAILDMHGHTALFDYFVIATGASRRQLHAVSEEIDHKLEDELKDKRMGIEGYDESKWIVLDYGSVVIHLFDEDTRKFYGLEALWGDAPLVDLRESLREFESQLLPMRNAAPASEAVETDADPAESNETSAEESQVDADDGAGEAAADETATDETATDV